MDSSFQVKENGLPLFSDQGFSGFDSCLSNSIGTRHHTWGGAKRSLALDGGKGEASGCLVKKKTSTTRNEASLKNHCESERRRRERINGHFSALRNFVPSTDKMDKASVLAGIISKIKVLREQATEATQGLLIPTVTDHLTVEPYTDHVKDGLFGFKATLCFEHKPELISDIIRAIHTLELTLMKAEISTLRNRVKSVLIITGSNQQLDADTGMEKVGECIHQALSCVMDKVYALDEYSLQVMFSKKRRTSLF